MPIGPALCDLGRNKPIAVNGIKKVFEVVRIRCELAEEIMALYLSLQISTLLPASYFSECEKFHLLCLSV